MQHLLLKLSKSFDYILACRLIEIPLYHLNNPHEFKVIEFTIVVAQLIVVPYVSRRLFFIFLHIFFFILDYRLLLNNFIHLYLELLCRLLSSCLLRSCCDSFLELLYSPSKLVSKPRNSFVPSVLISLFIITQHLLLLLHTYVLFCKSHLSPYISDLWQVFQAPQACCMRRN